MIKVTAIVTSYKRDISIVERAVNSILGQSFSNIEIIVVDDNDLNTSYSDALKILCEKKKIIYLTQGKNKGACSARNFGISHATGEYIGFLDDDDEWLPEKIEKQLKVFEKYPDIGIVYCRGEIVDENSGTVIGIYNQDNIKTNVTLEDILTKDYVGSTSQPLIKKL